MSGVLNFDRLSELERYVGAAAAGGCCHFGARAITSALVNIRKRPADHACRRTTARAMMCSLTGKSVSAYVERFAVGAWERRPAERGQLAGFQFQSSRALIRLIG